MKKGRIPFQGSMKKPDYFEGWYIKVVDPKSGLAFALIPGMSTAKGDEHSFIQLVSNKLPEPQYLRYALEEFIGHPAYFDVRIDGQRFCETGVKVAINTEEVLFETQLKFNKIQEYPYSKRHPSIMGPFNFLPGVNCHHAVYAMHAVVNGQVRIGDQRFKLKNAIAYIEKDFGFTFPKQYIWIQGNAFESEPKSSFLFTLAKVPHQLKEFSGHLGYLSSGNLFERFTTYDHAKIKKLKISPDRVELEITKKNILLKVEAQLSPGYTLKAPVKGAMTDQVKESLTGKLYIELYDDGLPLFSDSSNFCGIEVVGYEENQE